MQNDPFPKQYRPADHENRIRQRWEQSGAFHPEPKLKPNQRPFCIVIPPPNVTDKLHLGHALNNTLQDVLIRAHRMMCDATLWLPGTDHAGIATQTVVDKRLKAEGQPALADYKRIEAEEAPGGKGRGGRAQFVAKVQAWKDEYEARITEQLKAMGCSCDWARQRFTMDEDYALAVREAFFRLFRDGLIYRGKRLVNWDPVTQTALADDEVENAEIDGHFWYMRYPLAEPPDPDRGSVPVTWSTLAARGYPGAEAMPDEERAWVTVATTRPETYLGDTAVAVNPMDPRAKALRGLFVELPIVGRMIPIIEDDYVVLSAEHGGGGGNEADSKTEYATGFLKVTPAHDPNDWEIGQRHNLRVINVLAPDASISDQHGWQDVGDAGRFVGMSREEAREAIVKAFDDRGLLERTRPYRHTVGHSYRSHAAIEPYLSDQWYVRVTDDRLRGEALHAMPLRQRTSRQFLPRKGNRHDGRVVFHPERYARTFETWHENLRDWCISRQLWWGHRIPVWKIDVRRYTSLWAESYVKTEFDSLESLVRDGRAAIYGQKGDDYAPLRDAAAFRLYDTLFVCFDESVVGCPIDPMDDDIVQQDPDVLDTWFSSALWPIGTLGWPEETDLLRTFNPSSVLCTAREIITLWVSRMVMFNRYFRKDEDGSGIIPFRDVFIHAMIQDGEGRKMSKSLGNGVDPTDIIRSHGADAMRFTLCHMTTQTQDVRMPVELDPETGHNTSPKFDIGRNFCNKLWNAARFAHAILAESAAADTPPARGEGEAAGDVSRTGTERGSSARGPRLTTHDSLPDRWILSRLAAATTEITGYIADYQYASYAQALYDLLWRDFCDWYLEAIKPTVRSNPRQRSVLKSVLESILRLLHPIAPFITEAIHERLRDIEAGPVPGLALDEPRHDDLICSAGWPRVADEFRDEKAERDFHWVRSLVAAIREVRAQHHVTPKRRIVIHCPNAASLRRITAAGGLVEHLAGASRCTDEASHAGAPFTFESAEWRLSDLADEVDAATEKARLEKHLADLDKSIRTLDGRLNNPGYAEKAPPHMVQQTRDQLAEKRTERRTIEAALERLS